MFFCVTALKIPVIILWFLLIFYIRFRSKPGRNTPFVPLKGELEKRVPLKGELLEEFSLRGKNYLRKSLQRKRVVLGTCLLTGRFKDGVMFAFAYLDNFS